MSNESQPKLPQTPPAEQAPLTERDVSVRGDFKDIPGISDTGEISPAVKASHRRVDSQSQFADIINDDGKKDTFEGALDKIRGGDEKYLTTSDVTPERSNRIKTAAKSISKLVLPSHKDEATKEQSRRNKDLSRQIQDRVKEAKREQKAGKRRESITPKTYVEHKSDQPASHVIEVQADETPAAVIPVHITGKATAGEFAATQRSLEDKFYESALKDRVALTGFARAQANVSSVATDAKPRVGRHREDESYVGGHRASSVNYKARHALEDDETMILPAITDLSEEALRARPGNMLNWVWAKWQNAKQNLRDYYSEEANGKRRKWVTAGMAAVAVGATVTLSILEARGHGTGHPRTALLPDNHPSTGGAANHGANVQPATGGGTAAVPGTEHLTTYNAVTGAGTVDYATAEHMQRLGMHFTEAQHEAVVNHVLHYNHINDPTQLPVGYTVRFPSEDIIRHWLENSEED